MAVICCTVLGKEVTQASRSAAAGGHHWVNSNTPGPIALSTQQTCRSPTTVDRSQQSLLRECPTIQQKTNRPINATPHLYGQYIVKDAAAFCGDVNDLVCAINQVPATHKTMFTICVHTWAQLGCSTAKAGHLYESPTSCLSCRFFSSMSCRVRASICKIALSAHVLWVVEASCSCYCPCTCLISGTVLASKSASALRAATLSCCC